MCVCVCDRKREREKGLLAQHLCRFPGVSERGARASACSFSMHRVYQSRLLALIFFLQPPGPQSPLFHLLANPCSISSGRVLRLSSLAGSSRWPGLFNVKRMGRVPTARKSVPVGKPGERYLFSVWGLGCD